MVLAAPMDRGWARTNKARVERLIADGLMLPAGLAAIEEAERNGSWTRLDDVENLVDPTTCPRRWTQIRRPGSARTRRPVAAPSAPGLDLTGQAPRDARAPITEDAENAARDDVQQQVRRHD